LGRRHELGRQQHQHQSQRQHQQHQSYVFRRQPIDVVKAALKLTPDQEKSIRMSVKLFHSAALGVAALAAV
jgi:hypothetical protein